MEHLTMVPSPTPAFTESPEAGSLRELYHFIARMLPVGWKLRVTNANGDILYRVARRPTNPPQYRIHPVNNHENMQLIIRMKAVHGNAKFTLYKGENLIYSIRPAAAKRQFLLQDADRRILAKFTPITPETILLRSDVGTLARLFVKAHPSPLGWTIECKISEPQTWLLAVLLYVAVRIEDFDAEMLQEPPKQKSETESTEVDTP